MPSMATAIRTAQAELRALRKTVPIQVDPRVALERDIAALTDAHVCLLRASLQAGEVPRWASPIIRQYCAHWLAAHPGAIPTWLATLGQPPSWKESA